MYVGYNDHDNSKKATMVKTKMKTMMVMKSIVVLKKMMMRATPLLALMTMMKKVMLMREITQWTMKMRARVKGTSLKVIMMMI